MSWAWGGWDLPTLQGNSWIHSSSSDTPKILAIFIAKTVTYIANPHPKIFYVKYTQWNLPVPQFLSHFQSVFLYPWFLSHCYSGPGTALAHPPLSPVESSFDTLRSICEQDYHLFLLYLPKLKHTGPQQAKPSSNSCDKWMKNYNTHQVFIKLNHHFMHQQKNSATKTGKLCPTVNHFLFIGIVLFRSNAPSPSRGQGKVRVWAQRSRASPACQVWVQSAQQELSLSLTISWVWRCSVGALICIAVSEEEVSSTASVRQRLFLSGRPRAAHLLGMQLHTSSAQKQDR